MRCNIEKSAMEVLMKISASKDGEMFFLQILRSFKCLVNYLLRDKPGAEQGI